MLPLTVKMESLRLHTMLLDLDQSVLHEYSKKNNHPHPLAELPFTFALQIICRMERFSGNGIALYTLCWTKLALPVYDLAHHDK